MEKKLDGLGSREGVHERVRCHARGGALEESHGAALYWFIERVDAQIYVLAPLLMRWRLRHELARAVILVDGNSAALRGSTSIHTQIRT